jgi:uncharacterized membrane protein YcaP (DUF421 family)
MSDLLGLSLQPKDLSSLQVCLRAVIVFVAALIIGRVAHRRFMSKMSAFDVILGFVLSSMLARAINGSAPFWPTLLAGLMLVLLHRLLSAISLYSDSFGTLVKGKAKTVVENGVRQQAALRSEGISDNDLLEEIRLNGNLGSWEEVKIATLERNGQISVVHRAEN